MENRSFPQELFTEDLWLRYQGKGYVGSDKIKELLQRYNLKLRKGENITSITLAVGRGFKNTFGNASLAREQIAGELDKVCTIARWDFAVLKYGEHQK